ncbi:hypothetical protein ACM41_06200 [Bradyrhizobium sp. CCBAU 21362]|uniref:hypothetical protein n=1 Tax=Bradyrhizobium sp. CCBAU 21362 TaxID=1325082 RepID=UPI002305BD58|nr:hypothetical protein [Bradyrhizobium sp. CCBAU 21362]MDA9535868.1 hypothetical protein [Bradyrhizobium sp. CCBAU 21362]
MPKPVQIDADLYACAAAAASREGKHVETYINELLQMQLRDVERMHQIMRDLDEIAGDDAEGA